MTPTSPRTPSALPESLARRAATAAEEARFQTAWARRPANDPRYGWSNAGHIFLVQERERAVLRALARHAYLPLAGKAVLEVGCGSGSWLRDFVRWGAQPEDLAGIDLLADRVAETRRLCPPGVRVDNASATELPFESATFDLVLQATVFSSVFDADVKRRIATEMLRVLRPGGAVLWYDLRVDNPRNPDVRGLNRREIGALFAGCRIDLRRVTLAPPVARWVAARSTAAAFVLAAIPLLRSHYFGVFRPGAPV